MGERYGECLKSHADMSGERDGCQEFMADETSPLECLVCGCHRNFHSKPVQLIIEVFYTKCHKNHNLSGYSNDGCQEFIPGGEQGTSCTACGCHKSFHREEVRTRVTPTS